MGSWTSTPMYSWRLRRKNRHARRGKIETVRPYRSDTMVPEGLRPHSAIGAASGVTAPLEGRPAKDFSNWSCDTLDSSSVRDRGPRISPGGLFRVRQQCRYAGPDGSPGRGGSRKPSAPCAARRKLRLRYFACTLVRRTIRDTKYVSCDGGPGRAAGVAFKRNTRT